MHRTGIFAWAVVILTATAAPGRGGVRIEIEGTLSPVAEKAVGELRTIVERKNAQKAAGQTAADVVVTIAGDMIAGNTADGAGDRRPSADWGAESQSIVRDGSKVAI